MTILAFQLQAFGFNESKLPGGRRLFRLTILKLRFWIMFGWSSDLFWRPSAKGSLQGGDIVSVERRRRRRSLLMPRLGHLHFFVKQCALNQDYAVFPSLTRAAAAAEVMCQQRVKTDGALIQLAHHDLNQPRHYVQLEKCHCIHFQTVAEYQKQMSRGISGGLRRSAEVHPSISWDPWPNEVRLEQSQAKDEPLNWPTSRDLVFCSSKKTLILIYAGSHAVRSAITPQTTWLKCFRRDFCRRSVESFNQDTASYLMLLLLVMSKHRQSNTPSWFWRWGNCIFSSVIGKNS